MTIALDPREFLADPSVRPMARTRRVDLTAGDVVRENNSEYVVYSQTTKKNEVEVVRYLVPFAQERTDVGTPQESFRMLNPMEANGHFIFTPKVGAKALDNIDVDVNTPRDSTGTLSNNDRTKTGGINFISSDPWIDSQRYNPLFAFKVSSETQFRVTFQIQPLSTVSPLPSPYQIGTGAKRVDFAGVLVAGVILQEQLYGQLMQEVQTGGMSASALNNLFDLIQSGMTR